MTGMDELNLKVDYLKNSGYRSDFLLDLTPEEIDYLYEDTKRINDKNGW